MSRIQKIRQQSHSGLTRSLVRRCLCFAILCSLPVGILRAEDRAAPLRPAPPSASDSSGSMQDEASLQVRRIYVPAADLSQAIGSKAAGAILSKEEFERLLEQARKQQTATAEATPAVVQARYQGQVIGEFLQVQAELEIDSRIESAVLPLSLSGWQVTGATWGEAPAVMTQDERQPGVLRLLIEQAGRRTLHLELSAALEVAAGTPEVEVTVPVAGSGTFRVTLPREKLLNVNGVAQPQTETDGQFRSEFSIGGLKTMKLSVLPRRHDSQAPSALFAKTDLTLELSPAEVKCHALIGVWTSGQPVAEMFCRLPDRLDVTSVTGDGLAGWEVLAGADTPSSRRLRLRFQSPLTGQGAFQGLRAFQVQGILSHPSGSVWDVPHLTVEQALAQTGNVVIDSPKSLQVEVVQAQGVRAVAVDESSPARLAFEAWSPEFVLQLKTTLQPREVVAAMSTLLLLHPDQVNLAVSVNIKARSMPLFDLQMKLPVNLTVRDVTVDGKSVPWSQQPSDAGTSDVSVPFSNPILPGETRAVAVHADLHVDGWPPQQNFLPLAFPQIRLPQVTLLDAVYGVCAPDDLEVTPTRIAGLEPAGKAVHTALQSGLDAQGEQLKLAWTDQDQEFTAALQVRRQPATLIVRTQTQFTLRQEDAESRLTSRLTLLGGGQREFKLLLSESAGTGLRFQLQPADSDSIPARITQQVPQAPVNGMRPWGITCDQVLQGRYDLTLTSMASRPSDEPVGPVQIEFPEAVAQSGTLVVCGEDEAQVLIQTRGADGLPLPVIDPANLTDQLKSLAGRPVGCFEYSQPGWSLQASTRRFEALPLSRAVGQQAEITTVWAEQSRLQHHVQLRFEALGVQGVILRLPEDARLWAVSLSGLPVEMRRQGEEILVPMSQLAGSGERTLDLTYDSPQPETADFVAAAPTFQIVDGSGARAALPVLRHTWNLYYPGNVELIDVQGAWTPVTAIVQKPWPARLGKFIHFSPLQVCAGGLGLAVIALCLWGVTAWLRLRWPGRLLVVIVLLCACVPVVLLVDLLPVRTLHRLDALAARQAGPFGSRDPVFDKVVRDESFPGFLSETQPELSLPRPLNPANPPVSQKLQNAISVPPAAAAAPQSAGQTGVPPVSEPLSENSPQHSAGQRLSSGSPSDQATNEQGLNDRGLLSLAIQTEIPVGSRQGTFRYDGQTADQSPPQFRLRTASRQQLNGTFLAVLMGTLLIGWRLRTTRPALWRIWVVMTVCLPLAWLGLATGWEQLIARAILSGGVLSLLWRCLCMKICRRPVPAQGHSGLVHPAPGDVSPAGVSPVGLLLSVVLLSGGSLSADGPAPVDAISARPESKVIIPYSNLQELSASDQVWVPQALFQKLWQAAHPDMAVARLGAKAFVAEVLCDARLETADSLASVAVTGRLVLVNPLKTAQQVTLPVGGITLQSATFNGAAAPLLVTADRQSAIMLPEQGIFIVDVRGVFPVQVTPQAGRIELSAVPVPVGSLTLHLPASDRAVEFRVNGHPIVSQKDAGKNEVFVRTAIVAGKTLRIDWQSEPQRQQAQALRAEVVAAVNVTDTGLAIRQRITLFSRGKETAPLKLALPDGATVLSVSGTHVVGWELVDKARQIQVNLSAGGNASEEVTVELFRPVTTGEQPSTVPVQLAVPEQTQWNGSVGFFSTSAIELRVVNAGESRQQAARKFPGSAVLQAEVPLASYEFFGKPPVFEIQLSRIPARQNNTAEYGVRIGLQKIAVASRFRLTLAGAAQQSISVDLPAGYVLSDVVCTECTAWQIVKHENQSRLVLQLDRPRTGTIEVGLAGTIPRAEKTPQLELAVPWLELETQQSSLGLWVDPAELATISDAGSWSRFSQSDLPRTVLALQFDPVQFALRCSGTPKPLSIALQPVRPEFRTQSAVLIAVGDTTIDYGLNLSWTIERSMSDEFAVVVPAGLGQLEFTADQVRQIRSEPAGTGRTRWIVRTLQPVGQRYELRAAATTSLPADQKFSPPVLECQQLNAEGTWEAIPQHRQYAVLVNLSANHLVPEKDQPASSLTAAEVPFALPETLARQAVSVEQVSAMAVPVWRIQRAEPADLPPAYVVASTLTTVFQPDGSWRTQAVYGVRNRGQQFLAVRIPSAAQVLSVMVKDRPARNLITQVNEERVELIPLPLTSAADLSFDVTLILSGRLEQELPTAGSFWEQRIAVPAPELLSPEESPEFGVPSAQTLWNVYLPDGLRGRLVSGTGLSNMTGSSAANELAVELQTLQRARADLRELSRVLTDPIYSSQQRKQARGNLKNVEQQLQLRQNMAQSQAGSESSLGFYLQENEKVLDELRALTIQEDRPSQTPAQAPAEKSESVGTIGNRAFIVSNGLGFSSGQDLSKGSASSKTPADALNFFGVSDARRQAGSARQSQSQGDQSQLRSQMFQQLPMLSRQASPENKPGSTVERNRKLGKQAEPELQAGRPVELGALGREGMQAERVEKAGAPVTPQESLQTQPRDASGLSLPVQLPVNGRKLVFSRGGGAPQLTLSLVSRQRWQSVLGWLWGLGCVGLGLIILKQACQGRTAEIRLLVGRMLMIAGGVGALLFSFPVAALGVALFIAGVWCTLRVRELRRVRV